MRLTAILFGLLAWTAGAVANANVVNINFVETATGVEVSGSGSADLTGLTQVAGPFAPVTIAANGVRPSLGTLAFGVGEVDIYTIGASESFTPFGPNTASVQVTDSTGDVFRLTQPFTTGGPFTFGVPLGYVTGMDLSFFAVFTGQTFASMGITPLPVVTTFGANTVNLTFSPIPLPGALPLMLAGLGGLGFMSRRRARA